MAAPNDDSTSVAREVSVMALEMGMPASPLLNDGHRTGETHQHGHKIVGERREHEIFKKLHAGYCGIGPAALRAVKTARLADSGRRLGCVLARQQAFALRLNGLITLACPLFELGPIG